MIRIATYNIEWFISLFDKRGRLLEDGERSARYGVSRAEQLQALGAVFTALDADLVVMQEAPDHNTHRQTVPMLEAFAARFGLRQRRALLGFANETQQEIACLYDPDRLTLRHDPQEGPQQAPRFDRSAQIALQTGQMPEWVSFNKPPLELLAELPSGKVLRLIGVHIKSKAAHGAGSPEAERRLAVEARRVQLAQALWLRARVEAHLARGESLVVLGDFNDGPGLDEYEQLLGRSSVEVVLGEGAGALVEPHARRVMLAQQAAGPSATSLSSARFYWPEEKRYFSALLDYIMLSPDLCTAAPCWRIWHPFDDARLYGRPALREALLAASDHYPVSVDLDL